MQWKLFMYTLFFSFNDIVDAVDAVDAVWGGPQTILE